MNNLLLQLGCIKSTGHIVQKEFKQLNFLNFPVSKFLNNKNIKNSSIPVIIPGNQLVLKIFPNIPFSSKKNLDKLIYYKIQTDVLPDLQKLNYFYIILDENRQTREYITAVFFYNNTLLDSYNQIADKNHVFPESFIFNIYLFVEYLKNLKSKPAGLYIQSFDNYSYIGIKKQNSLQYIRIINSPPDKLNKDIQDTIQYYKKANPGEEIKNIILLNPNIDLKLNNCHIEQCPINENNFYSPAFKSSIPGIIFGKTKKEIIFNKILNLSFKTSLFFSLFIIAIFFINLNIKNKTKLYSAQLKNLESSLKIIKPLREKENKYNEMRLIQNKILPLQSIVSSILVDFSKTIPEQIRLKNLLYEKSKFKIEGYAKDIEIINTFINKLNETFSNVDLVSTEQEKFGEKNLVNFIISFKESL